MQRKERFPLSQRMQAAVDFVPEGVCAADVGCDHGHVSIELIRRQICRHVIAMDVNAGPLSHAQENIRAAGFSQYIETRLSDGLEALAVQDGRAEADGAVMAGMGGRLMLQILSEGADKAAALRFLVLQPQSEIGAVRCFLREEAGYFITAENMVLEDGKYYQVMQAVNLRFSNPWGLRKEAPAWIGSEEDRRLADEYGGWLLQERHPVLRRFLERERKLYEGILAGIPDPEHPRRTEIQEKLALGRKALAFWTGGDRR